MVPFPPNPQNDTRLMLPRINPSEVRSYRYFLEVVGPALSGFFDGDFWLHEIPRVCHADAAIWHAVVSLGAMHEGQGGSLGTGNQKIATFAIQQFNYAVRCLTQATSPRHLDKGRALTVSTIFTCMAYMQGQHEQGAMHLQAGCKLLTEFEKDDTKPIVKSRSKLEKSQPTFETLPISIEPVRNILVRMDMMMKALANGGLVGSASSSQIHALNIFRVWRTYTAPSESRKGHSTLTPETALAANRAAESLMNGLVYNSQEQGDVLGSMMGGEEERQRELARLAAVQRPHVRGYKELRKAVEVFERELLKPNCGSAKATKEQLSNAIVPVKLFLAVCRMIFIVDPDEPDIHGRARGFPKLCEDILDNAEKILALDETYIDVGGRRIPFTPNITTMDALFMVAHAGSSLRVRRQAAEMLRRPRLEGLWHSIMAANLADAVIDRELEALQEYKQERMSTGEASSGYEQVAFDEEADVSFIEPEDADKNGLYRVRTMCMNFTGPRSAVVRMQTWGEWLNGHHGRYTTLTW